MIELLEINGIAEGKIYVRIIKAENHYFPLGSVVEFVKFDEKTGYYICYGLVKSCAGIVRYDYQYLSADDIEFFGTD